MYFIGDKIEAKFIQKLFGDPKTEVFFALANFVSVYLIGVIQNKVSENLAIRYSSEEKLKCFRHCGRTS